MSIEKDSRRTALISDRAIAGAPLGVVVQRLLVLILALCDMLDKKGVDSDNLLQGMTFEEEVSGGTPPKKERYGTA